MNKMKFVVAIFFLMKLQQAAAQDVQSLGTLNHGYDEARITVSSLAFSPDGKTLAATVSRYAKNKGEVMLFDISSMKKIGVASTVPSDIRSVSYSPDGKLLAIAHGYGVRVISAETSKSINEFHLERLIDVEPIAVAPDSKTLAVCTRATLFLFDALTGKENGRFTCGGESYVSSFVSGPPTFSSDGKLMGFVRDDKVLVWDLVTMKETISFPVRRGHSTALSPNGNIISIGTNGSRKYPGNHTFKIWDVKTGELRWNIGDFTPFSPVFTPDGKFLIFGTSLRSTNDYKDTFEQLELAKKHLQAATTIPNAVDEKSLQLAREATQKALDGMHLLIQTIKVFDVTTGKTFTAVDAPIFFSLATNGKLLATANYNGTISLWDISAVLKNGFKK